ncbi:hypothetical protein MAPG_03101 [Magnaporthiopsis poae ATCC 64411]|uniref:DUF7603 domain-containing protein n=1 Tax=Magnaporthiopsis poae (strain ATCC 64411 / 73-15) TaxID=644358 RepID=A0A0C4DT45_MAGP6|nr:hypothetical protein MAPG_03101 [Magnaporthiopsis poae ATCC 64411]
MAADPPTPAPAPQANFDAPGPYSSDTRPAAPAPSSSARVQSQNAPQVLPSPRSSRSPSLATRNSVSSIKRKPLSANASAVARRYSQSSQSPRSPPSPPSQHYLDILDELPMPQTLIAPPVDSSWYAGETPVVDHFADAYRSSEEGGLSSKALPQLPPQSAAAESVPRGAAPAQPRNIPELNPAAPQTLLSFREHQQNRSAGANQSLKRGDVSQDSDIDLDVTSRVAQGLEAASGGGVDQPSDPSSQPEAQSPNTNNTVGPKIMSLFARKPSPPHLKLVPTTDNTPKPTAAAAAASDATPTIKAGAADNLNPQTKSPATKSPGSSKLGNFFGWSTSSPSSTIFSEGISPLESPYWPKPPAFVDDAPLTAATSSPPTAKPTYDISADESPLDYCEAYLHTPPDATTPTPAATADKIEDMEDELKAISAELAASIRREMDLEDLVDRLQAQVGGRGDTPGKRTSDYFSDSGYSSAKLSEYDANREEITQLQRRAEQEKAQVRLELSQKLQDERERRRDLDRQIQELNTVKGSADGARRTEASPLSRSNTVKGTTAGPHQTESREAISERLKDVEAQRDALHNALRSLLERQEFQNRENEKKIRILEQERSRLLAASPQKAGYERDVSNLREEIALLRKRAEEAMEQKWQVEKGLSGLKMDLDRAEEEIAGLRSLLREKDILIPATFARPLSTAAAAKENDPTLSTPVSSASLEKAYKDLQAAYAQALERIKGLELGTADDKTRAAMDRLERSVASKMDDAEVQQLRERVEDLEQSAQANMEAERDLADQLQASARRVEELAAQVQAQLATNASLRDAALRRGHARRVGPAAAEDRIARQDEELRQLREANNGQIQRLRDASGGLRSPSQRLFPPRSPLSPIFTNGMRSPRFGSRPASRTGSSSGGRSPASPLAREREEDQTAQMEKLRARVAELETALSTADSEMQEVVGRMNTAQIEVLQLQEEREQAVRETRRLQRQLEAEQAKASTVDSKA